MSHKLRLNRETLRVLEISREVNGAYQVTVPITTAVCSAACLPQFTDNCTATWWCPPCTGPICFKSIRP